MVLARYWRIPLKPVCRIFALPPLPAAGLFSPPSLTLPSSYTLSLSFHPRHFPFPSLLDSFQASPSLFIVTHLKVLFSLVFIVRLCFKSLESLVHFQPLILTPTSRP